MTDINPYFSPRIWKGGALQPAEKLTDSAAERHDITCGPSPLWSAAACCRFLPASLLAGFARGCSISAIHTLLPDARAGWRTVSCFPHQAGAERAQLCDSRRAGAQAARLRSPCASLPQCGVGPSAHQCESIPILQIVLSGESHKPARGHFAQRGLRA